ncbi:hypothetical protein KAW65_01150 [candidate division WOR-3 bacterium]|nr:hypothetical protein [candidate division WOR-3 bacterium]
MRFKHKELIVIPFVLFALNVCATNVFIDDPLIETVEELRVRGVPLVKYPNVKPYLLKDFLEQQGINKWLISRLVPKTILKLDSKCDSIKVTRLSISADYENGWVNIILEPIAKFGDDNIWPTRKFKGIVSTDYERASIRFSPQNFSLILGRERFAFGPSPRYNLLLSGYSPPIDGLFWSYEAPKFKLSFLFSRLEDIWTDTLEFEGDSVRQLEPMNSRRFLSIRRIDFLPKDWINIGLTEAVIYGGPERFPDFYYLNPLTLNYPYQFTRGGFDDNILWDVDGRIDFKNFGIYGEFIIDDFQYGSTRQKDPNQTGFLIGLELADPLKFAHTFLWLEYTRITRWVYTYFIPSERYEYLGYPIGHPLGPDFDNIFMKFTYHFKPQIDFYGTFSYTRHGAGKVETLWPIPEHPRESPPPYFPDNNFLSEPVHTYLDVNFGFNIFKTFYKQAMSLQFFPKVGFCKSSEGKYLPVFKFTIKLCSSTDGL